MMYGTIQVDLDGLWTYRRYFGQSQPGSAEVVDPVYAEGLMRFLELFKKYNVKATFFIVGKDAQQPEQRKLIARLVEAGHEIANHTMSHPQHFNLLSAEQVEDEISDCDKILQEIGTKAIAGFRAPGFSIQADTLSILREKGYMYDTSVIPSSLIPFIMNISHSILRRKPVCMGAGRIGFGFAPLDVYNPDQKRIWKKGDSLLFEVPVSVIPGLRLPLHSSYVFMFGKGYFRYGLKRLQKNNVSPCYLFHGIDLVDLEKQKVSIPFFKTLEKRLNVCEYIIKSFSKKYELLTTRQLVQTNGMGL
ncbi:MAG: polysaccharide deacetylase family protein [PVC group bacterium]|nr:polysaccharide deacetylase family protein [PVC group bacterium]